jgi:hypothetical protein
MAYTNKNAFKNIVIANPSLFYLIWGLLMMIFVLVILIVLVIPFAGFLCMGFLWFHWDSKSTGFLQALLPITICATKCCFLIRNASRTGDYPVAKSYLIVLVIMLAMYPFRDYVVEFVTSLVNIGGF